MAGAGDWDGVTGKGGDPERAGSEALYSSRQWAHAAVGIPGGYSRYIMTCRGTGLFRADHTLFPGSLTRKLYKKKIPEMILEVPEVPGTKERELAEKPGMTHEMGSRVSR